ncbi:response regulator receiver modulated diguanylate cyclase [Mizugakiibacter sediminis]|uniref:diguanylate cyclase n=1 Tax=Mizugakiibacter sediminis TaxID=1475481 RepID=A0A0K8QKE7_9GAMM|nr:diguanylate cyclase [Mizugakiibacter sediminis]GAP65425.1 response regulator receiver modulated diguanylate cyclase [Mizugakiibacter sediminis]
MFPRTEDILSLNRAGSAAEWMDVLRGALARRCGGAVETELHRPQPGHAFPSEEQAPNSLRIDDEDGAPLARLRVDAPAHAGILESLRPHLGHLATLLALERARQKSALADLLVDLSYILLFEEDLDTLLQGVIGYIYRRFHLSLATIGLIEPGSGELTLRAFAGESHVPLELGRTWPADRGITGRALRTGSAVFVPDVTADPEYIEGNALTRAELVIPIRHRGQILGMLNMESPAAESFNADVRAVLDLLADQIGGVLHLTMLKLRLQEVNSATQVMVSELAALNGKLQRANRRLAASAMRDTLTGIGNRRGFDFGLRRAWTEARSKSQLITLLLIDVDHFKAYNDRYGHPAGDACLRSIGQTIRGSLRGHDIVCARYGGEEFAVVLRDAGVVEGHAVAVRICKAVEQLALPHEDTPAGRVSLSVGVASVAPTHGRRAAELVKAADAALYRAKQNGRNRIEIAIEPPAAQSA